MEMKAQKLGISTPLDGNRKPWNLTQTFFRSSKIRRFSRGVGLIQVASRKENVFILGHNSRLPSILTSLIVPQIFPPRESFCKALVALTERKRCYLLSS